jgi:hypothetical protein
MSVNFSFFEHLWLSTTIPSAFLASFSVSGQVSSVPAVQQLLGGEEVFNEANIHPNLRTPNPRTQHDCSSSVTAAGMDMPSDPITEDTPAAPQDSTLFSNSNPSSNGSLTPVCSM